MKLKIIINILVAILIFFLFDFIVFKGCLKAVNINDLKYTQHIFKKISTDDNYDKKSLSEDWDYRGPYNDNSKEKSIVFTGCSFAYGQGLKETETLPYLISKMTSHPVYNLGIVSAAINHTISMLKLGIFEEKVKQEPAVVIYIYSDFHIYRLVMPNIIFEPNEYLYKIKKDELVKKRPPFIVSRFIILSLIREHLIYFLSKYNLKYNVYLKKLLKIHILSMNKILLDKYPNTKFIIIVYNNSPNFETIEQELEKQGIIIIRVNQDFGIDTFDNKYVLDDGHPNAEVWQIIAPKLYKKIKDYL